MLPKEFYNLKLNIMKKAIAMKCNEEQFDAVKPKLKDFEITSIDPFETYEYLVNNGGNQNNLITNIKYEGRSTYAREIHETWNEKVFLEACGIETTPTLEEVKEYFKNAKEVKIKYISDVYNVSEPNTRGYFEFKDGYWLDLQGFSIRVWSEEEGYAKILTYKEPKEESFVITKEQIQLIEHQSVNEDFGQVARDMREWFPTAFELEKKELAVGRWYKTTENDSIFFLNKKNGKSLYGYGISYEGKWKDTFEGTDDRCKYEATQQEVEEVLKAEILKRYKVGDRVNCLKLGNVSLNCELNLDSFDHCFEDDQMWVSSNEGEETDSMVCVYSNGIFAEIIQPKKMTKSEAEKMYNIEIV